MVILYFTWIVCGRKLVIVMLPAMYGDQMHGNTNNRSQYVKRISVRPWNLPCSLQALLFNVSLGCHRNTRILQFAATGWRHGCSKLQILGCDCFQHVCHSYDLALTFTVISPVIRGEGQDGERFLLKTVLQCKEYKYFDMTYLSNLRWTFIVTEKGDQIIILQHFYTCHMIHNFVVNCLIYIYIYIVSSCK